MSSQSAGAPPVNGGCVQWGRVGPRDASALISKTKLCCMLHSLWRTSEAYSCSKVAQTPALFLL